MSRFLVAGLVFAAVAGAQAPPRVVYSKSFPGSLPAYTEIVVEKDGACLYKEDPKDEDPIKFQLGASDRDQIYALAGKLGNFGREIESGLKVAFMGAKVFHWEGPDGTREVKFNYSEDPDAKALNDLFEQIAETERAFAGLERAVKFDKLGAQDALLRVEALRDQKRLVPQEQFLPLLDRIVKNESFLHMARDRASNLADGIRKVK